MRLILGVLVSFFYMEVMGQQMENCDEQKDVLFIEEVEGHSTTEKVLHAEPLFIDLIRDLGARKGEKEWNVGFGLSDKLQYDSYSALVEYEWAPIDRLGLEIELPFTLNFPNRESDLKSSSKLNGLKLATQYSFFVSEKLKTSLAIGYINELEFASFQDYGKRAFVTGNVYNPFIVGAKRWGNNFHTLVYTGPAVNHHFSNQRMTTDWQINTNFHYMISGTRNFVGIEFNKNLTYNQFSMTLRPQMRVGITENLIVGIVTGIPVNKNNERFSAFMRLIYEPKHHKLVKKISF
jgi:hypothetical protein